MDMKEIGKGLNQLSLDSETALRRDKPQSPRVEHARDIFDSFIPFDMTFRTREHDIEKRVTLDFAPPPSNCCCTNCFCSECEYFTGITDPVLTMTHDIKPGSVSVLVNEVLYTGFTTGVNFITLGFTPVPEDEIKVCYTFEILLFQSTKCEDCQAPAYTQLIEYEKDFDSVHPTAFTTVINFPAQTAQFTAGIGATFAEYIGHPTWAHATIPGAPGSGSEDTPIEGIAIYNLLAVVDGDPGTCSCSQAVVMRTGAGDVQPNGTGYTVFWEVHFPRPVKLCSIASIGGDYNEHDGAWSILYVQPDGLQDVTTQTGLNAMGGNYPHSF